jgi:predicted DNA-binding protein (MmcQ/YjbR family)
MTVQQYRKMALSLPGAEEKSHFNHPDFRAGGRIFATLGYPDNGSGCVTLTPEEQREFLKSHPETFVPAKGAWGLQGSTIVKLASADLDAVGEALTLAWKRVMAKLPAKNKVKKKAVAKKRS